MHESGLVGDLIHEVTKVAKANGGARVARVGVGIGARAGFSREHFEEHFRAASIGTKQRRIHVGPPGPPTPQESDPCV